jgi:hypothetical protein
MSGWERALWIVGLALILFSGAFIVVVVKVIYGTSIQSGSDSNLTIQGVLTAISFILPGTTTVGLMSIVIAIAIRAGDRNADVRDSRRVMATAAATAPDGPVELAQAIVQPSTPAPAPQPLDHSIFMRPRPDAPPAD